MTIPFHKPYYDQDDEQALLKPLKAGKMVGDGDFTREASACLASLLGVKHVLLTPSCTHALELGVNALGISRGDEVIMPSFTFVSSADAVLRQGGSVVFADIDPSTLTVNVEDVARRITSRTKAIMPVLYAGVSAPMAELVSLAGEHGLAIIEDAAQGVAAAYRGRPAGTMGDIGCFSFHETKNYSTGEGGAIATNNDALMARAEIIREKGTNRKQFLQGLVDKYTWVDVGSSYLPPDTMGALLLSQIQKREVIQRRRGEIYHRYIEELQPLAATGLITLPTIPHGQDSNHHIFHVLLRDEPTRNQALSFFRNRGIGTTFHYLPLHLSPVGLRLGGYAGQCPVTENVSGRLLRLPIYPSLSAEEQRHVIATMEEFLKL